MSLKDIVIEERPITICPLCSGLPAAYQINDNMAVILCQNINCVYPFGHTPFTYIYVNDGEKPIQPPTFNVLDDEFIILDNGYNSDIVIPKTVHSVKKHIEASSIHQNRLNDQTIIKDNLKELTDQQPHELTKYANIIINEINILPSKSGMSINSNAEHGIINISSDSSTRMNRDNMEQFKDKEVTLRNKTTNKMKTLPCDLTLSENSNTEHSNISINGDPSPRRSREDIEKSKYKEVALLNGTINEINVLPSESLLFENSCIDNSSIIIDDSLPGTNSKDKDKERTLFNKTLKCHGSENQLSILDDSLNNVEENKNYLNRYLKTYSRKTEKQNPVKATAPKFSYSRKPTHNRSDINRHEEKEKRIKQLDLRGITIIEEKPTIEIEPKINFVMYNDVSSIVNSGKIDRAISIEISCEDPNNFKVEIKANEKNP